MTGEKDAADLCAENAQKAAPAEMPGVEEIKRVLFEFATCTNIAKGPAAVDANAGSFARAILDLFAPILAEKERDNRQLKLEVAEERETSRISIYGWRDKANEMEARALAAEAALAGLRQSILDAEIQSDDDEKAQARLDRLAAAIREGE